MYIVHNLLRLLVHRLEDIVIRKSLCTRAFTDSYNALLLHDMFVRRRGSWEEGGTYRGMEQP